MTEQPEVTVGWDEAVTSGSFVTLTEDEPKTIFIKNWKLVKAEKFGKEQVELIADCTEEDGKEVEKSFTTTSNRLKKKLRAILEHEDKEKGVKISIIKIGEKFNTNYSTKKVE